MRSLLVVLFAATVAPLLAAGSEDGQPETTPMKTIFVPAPDSRIAIVGRMALVDGEVRMGFPGTAIRFAYRGPAPELRLTASSPNCFFNLACNGWDPVLLHLSEGANGIPLPAGPAPAEGWLVELVRRNESWQGVAAFQGLVLPEGCELLPPPPFPSRKLMCIGDSITCGEYVDRFPPELDNTPRTANATRAFGMLLGRWLDAQVHLVSYGGRGILRDWQGHTETNNAPQFFELALPDDPSIPWDHAAWQPDAIVVCLGTNDFSPDLPDEAGYTAAYARFVARLREVHPGAAILLAESPVFGEEPDVPGGGKRGRLRRCLDAVAAQRRAGGDERIVVAPVRYQPGTPTNAHPVAFQHEQIAQDLLEPLRALTGW